MFNYISGSTDVSSEGGGLAPAPRTPQQHQHINSPIGTIRRTGIYRHPGARMKFEFRELYIPGLRFLPGRFLWSIGIQDL